jgi:hypothetical protein
VEDADGHELVDRSLAKGRESTLATPSAAGRRGSSSPVRGDSDSQGPEEVLTIDGEVETPKSRRGKKRQSRGEGEDYGEVVRLEELPLGRKGSLRSVLWPIEDNGAEVQSVSPFQTLSSSIAEY